MEIKLWSGYYERYKLEQQQPIILTPAVSLDLPKTFRSRNPHRKSSPVPALRNDFPLQDRLKRDSAEDTTGLTVKRSPYLDEIKSKISSRIESSKIELSRISHSTEKSSGTVEKSSQPEPEKIVPRIEKTKENVAPMAVPTVMVPTILVADNKHPNLPVSMIQTAKYLKPKVYMLVPSLTKSIRENYTVEKRN